MRYLSNRSTQNEIETLGGRWIRPQLVDGQVSHAHRISAKKKKDKEEKERERVQLIGRASYAAAAAAAAPRRNLLSQERSGISCIYFIYFSRCNNFRVPPASGSTLRARNSWGDEDDGERPDE